MNHLMGRVARLLVLVSVAASALVVIGGPARACSCAQMSPTEALDLADAAFVGRLADVAHGGFSSEGDPSFQPAASLFTFEVDQVVKGDLPATVEVRTPSSSAACGASFAPQKAAAVLLVRSGGTWSTNLCLQQVSVPQLLQASGDEPRPPTGETETEPPPGDAPDSDLTSGVGDDSAPGAWWIGVLLIVAAGTGVLVVRSLRRARAGFSPADP